ncbi:hypothetical protein [Brucella pseudogrignonensis]|uniref:Uncharacterized protein n=1 Tax=Brucella pseudogrignonensis TaxID=419475 RepID=A0ABU1M5E5_9HYPH|nr:hypothetical protein [Brucella pseudogrignonensis]MDR6431265.1 hypothetical protein [Brucella pseudogrignonensis]
MNRKRAGLWTMLQTASSEAHRINGVQDALVRNGMRDKPCPNQIAKANVFTDIADLISSIIPVKEDVAKVLAPVAQARAKSGQAGFADQQSNHQDDNSEQ